MQRYCKNWCNVDLVLEAPSEKSSSMSKAANISKKSREKWKQGIKLSIKSVQSWRPNNTVKRKPYSTLSKKESESSYGPEEVKSRIRAN